MKLRFTHRNEERVIRPQMESRPLQCNCASSNVCAEVQIAISARDVQGEDRDFSDLLSNVFKHCEWIHSNREVSLRKDTI